MLPVARPLAQGHLVLIHHASDSGRKQLAVIWGWLGLGLRQVTLRNIQRTRQKAGYVFASCRCFVPPPWLSSCVFFALRGAVAQTDHLAKDRRAKRTLPKPCFRWTASWLKATWSSFIMLWIPVESKLLSCGVVGAWVQTGHLAKKNQGRCKT